MTEPDDVSKYLRSFQAAGEVPANRRARSRAAMLDAFDAAWIGAGRGEAELLQLVAIEPKPERAGRWLAVAASIVLVALVAWTVVGTETADEVTTSGVEEIFVADQPAPLRAATVDLSILEPGLQFTLDEPMTAEVAATGYVRLQRVSDQQRIELFSLDTLVGEDNNIDVRSWIVENDAYQAQVIAVTADDPRINLEQWTGTLVATDECAVRCPFAQTTDGTTIELTAGQRNTIWVITVPSGAEIVAVSSVPRSNATDTVAPFSPLVRSAALAD